MKQFPTVILYDRDGRVITREDGIDGMARARERAAYLLSDQYAESCETTHEALRTRKVAIFDEHDVTGVDALCLFDRDHPQQRQWDDLERRVRNVVAIGATDDAPALVLADAATKSGRTEDCQKATAALSELEGSLEVHLVNTETRRPLQVGDDVTTFRGEAAKLTGMRKPARIGSTGRVLIRVTGATSDLEFYPSVIGAEWARSKNQSLAVVREALGTAAPAVAAAAIPPTHPKGLRR